MNEISLNNNAGHYQDKYENHLNEHTVRASVFSDPIRRTLLKMKGPRNNISGFWGDIRTKVQYGLKEFELFFETAPDKRIKRIINSEQIQSLLDTILPTDEREDQPPTVWRKHMAAEIAKNCLDYLLRNNAIKSINDQTDLFKVMGIIDQCALANNPHPMTEDGERPDVIRSQIGETEAYKAAKKLSNLGKEPDGTPRTIRKFEGPDDPNRKTVWELMHGDRERKFKKKEDADA